MKGFHYAFAASISRNNPSFRFSVALASPDQGYCGQLPLRYPPLKLKRSGRISRYRNDALIPPKGGYDHSLFLVTLRIGHSPPKNEPLSNSQASGSKAESLNAAPGKAATRPFRLFGEPKPADRTPVTASALHRPHTAQPRAKTSKIRGPTHQRYISGFVPASDDSPNRTNTLRFWPSDASNSAVFRIHNKSKFRTADPSINESPNLPVPDSSGNSAYFGASLSHDWQENVSEAVSLTIPIRPLGTEAPPVPGICRNHLAYRDCCGTSVEAVFPKV